MLHCICRLIYFSLLLAFLIVDPEQEEHVVFIQKSESLKWEWDNKTINLNDFTQKANKLPQKPNFMNISNTKKSSCIISNWIFSAFEIRFLCPTFFNEDKKLLLNNNRSLVMIFLQWIVHCKWRIFCSKKVFSIWWTVQCIQLITIHNKGVQFNEVINTLAKDNFIIFCLNSVVLNKYIAGCTKHHKMLKEPSMWQFLAFVSITDTLLL